MTGAVTLSARTFRLASATKRALDRVGLTRLPPVAWAARLARDRLFADEAGRSVRVKTDGLLLHVPRDATRMISEHEPLTDRWLRDAVKPGMTAVDVGAHVGYFSLLLSTLVGEGGRVYAVEPAEQNLDLLRKNIAANERSNVVVLPFAAGKERRERTFNVTGFSWTHGFYDHPEEAVVATATILEVPLDDELAGPVDFVKIDVEGAELEVLEGMRRVVEQSADLRLIVEWSPACQRSAGREPHDLPRYLEERGFAVSVLDEKAGRARPVDEVLDALERGALEPLWYGNLAATRAPRP